MTAMSRRVPPQREQVRTSRPKVRARSTAHGREAGGRVPVLELMGWGVFGAGGLGTMSGRQAAWGARTP